MSQFLITLHRAKDKHVSGEIQTLRDRGTSEFLIRQIERLLTTAFIAGARAATCEIGEQEQAEVERLEAMENERQRFQDSRAVRVMDVEPGNLIKMALYDNV